MKSLPLKDRHVPPWVFFVGVLLALAAVELVTPGHLKTWVAGDYRVALESLIEERPFRSEKGDTLFRYAPLFPLLLFAETRAADTLGIGVRLLAAILGALAIAASATMIWQLTRRFARQDFAVAAGLGAALLPHLLWAWMRNLSVVPFLPFLLASVALVAMHVQHACRGEFSDRLKLGALAAGVLLGVATLFRPISLYLPAVLAPALLLAPGRIGWRRRTLAPLLFLSGMLAALLPWEVWLYRETGKIIPVTSSSVISLRDGISFNNKSFRDPLPMSPRLQELQRRIGNEYASFDSSSALLSFLLREAKRDPLAVAELYGLKVVRSWYGLDTQDRSRERWLKWLALLYLIPTTWAVWICLTALRRLRPANERSLSGEERSALATGWLVIGITLYFWGMTTIATTIVRYMVPVFMLLPVLWACALTLQRGPHERSARRIRPG